jgi:heme-degrading monooxygenase HmoA
VSFWTASGLDRLLETLPGFQDGAMLEQIDSWKHLKIVTLATWENREAFTPRGGSASEVSEGRLRSAELIARLGIEADPAAYRPLGA